MRRLFGAVCVATALAVSACGTTVPGAASMAGPQSGATADEGLGLAPPQPGGQTTAAGRSGALPGVVGSVAGVTAGSAAGVGGAGYAPGSGVVSDGAAAPTVTGRGITAKTITVGIPLATDTSAVVSAFGINGAGSLSPQDVINAAVANVNETGGILGRKLVVYIHGYSAAAWVSNPAQVDNEICTDFRDDHHVFAVMYDLVDTFIRHCTAEMGSPLIAIGAGDLFPESAYTANGGSYLYAPTTPTSDRLAHLFVQSLMARNFQQKWNITAGGPGVFPTKFGVIHVDQPDVDAYYADIEKELSKYGFKFVDTATYDNNVQAGFAATQSAVLKFRADGISHIFGASTFFLEDAESQKYYPRYAYLPGLGELGVANAPADQLNGALTVGWTPISDVDAHHDPGDTPGAKHCRAVMKADGIESANRSDRDTMYTVCDAIFSFRAAADAGVTPSVAGLRAGFESLGTTFPTALSFGALLDKFHHYGVDSVRDMAFDSRCKCLVYTSRTNRS